MPFLFFPRTLPMALLWEEGTLLGGITLSLPSHHLPPPPPWRARSEEEEEEETSESVHVLVGSG